MGIRERGYRHWQGQYSSHAFRWWTVAKQGLRATVYNKPRLVGILFFMFLVWAPYIFYSLSWFLVGAFLFGEGGGDVNVGQLRDPDLLLRDSLYNLVRGWEVAIFPIFVAMVAAPLVSNDLRSNALYIYLAKPLRRIDYILGKLVTIALWTLPVTLLPNFLVWTAAIASSDKSSKLSEAGEIFFEIFVIQLVFLLVLAFAALAASSLTKRWQVALMTFLGGYYVLWLVSNILQDTTRQRTWALVSLPTNLINFAKHIFERAANQPPWETSLGLCLALALGALALFVWRILKLEVAE